MLPSLAADDKASHLVTELLKTNDSFEAFAVEAAAKPESGGQNLLALLLTPIQRVPRYRLLLADLVKCTPSDHPDHDDVVQAYDTTTEVATFINQSLKCVCALALMTLAARPDDSSGPPLAHNAAWSRGRAGRRPTSRASSPCKSVWLA